MRLQNTSTDRLTVIIWPKDVTYLSTILIWNVWHAHIDSVPLVGSHNKHITLAKREEMVRHVPFNIRIVPNLCTLAGLIDISHKLIHVRAGVHCIPERFSVCGVVATAEVLLISIVKERNTSCSHCESDSIFERRNVVWEVIQPSRVIMIVHK